MPELVRCAQAGDVQAFERLYREKVGHVYAVCLRMVANVSRAERLTQDAFVQAWQHLDSFRGHSTFSTWLHRVTINVVLGDVRAEKRRKKRFQSTDDPASHEVAVLQPTTGTGIDLENGIAALPPKARAVLVLHDIEGYQHKEIGKMLGIATGTSKAHLHRARNLLKEKLS